LLIQHQKEFNENNFKLAVYIEKTVIMITQISKESFRNSGQSFESLISTLAAIYHKNKH